MGKRQYLIIITVITAALHIVPAAADPDKDESGSGREYRHERHDFRHKGASHKEEHWEGNCKVERKWDKSSDYKEERSCRYEDEPEYEPTAGIVIELPPIVLRPAER